MTTVEIIEEFYSGLNRFDLDTALKHLHPNVLRVEFEGMPGSGTYRGVEQLREHISKGRSTWDEGSCEPVAYIHDKNKVVVVVQIDVQVKNQEKRIVATSTDGFCFDGDLIIEFHSFTSKDKALAWANS